ncbi:MAG: hypothetical protein H0X37_04350 [Herpetosiphonaceae bacterium]|nr:hypothetical protein [Herpetosiphonaceae bacterium]
MHHQVREIQGPASGRPDGGAQPRARRPGVDRGFLLLVLGAVVLILLGLISIPLLGRRTPALAPVNTAEGTVQRFYQAAYQGDYQAAYRFLSSDTQRQLTVSGLQQQIGDELKNSQMVVSKTTVHEPTATVEVKLTYVQPGGLFSSDQYTNNREILLQREGSDWKIISGPFYLEPKR